MFSCFWCSIPELYTTQDVTQILFLFFFFTITKDYSSFLRTGRLLLHDTTFVGHQFDLPNDLILRHCGRLTPDETNDQETHCEVNGRQSYKIQ